MFNVQSPISTTLNFERARGDCSRHRNRPNILFFSPLFGQEKQYCEGPDAENQARGHPETFGPPAVAGDNAAKNRIEKMDQRRRAQQRCRINLWSKKNKSGEIT